MKISIKEMIDYTHCPMFYRFRYRSKRPETIHMNLYEKYDSDIHKFMYAYHSHLQNGDIVDGSTVKRIWGSLWIGEKNKQDMIFTDTGDKRDTWNEKRKQGIECLMNYHSRGKKNTGTPVLVNHEFDVDIVPGVQLTGTFDLIQEINGQVELINFIADSKKLTQPMIRKDLKTTALSFAFRQSFSQREDNLVVYYVDRNKKNISIRTERDYEIFKESAKNIAISIKNDLFYINPNPKCISCIYKDKCDNFVSKEDMI